MYAQYDDIIFEPISSFDSISDTEGAVWAEHAPLTGKPKLQPTGLNAREMSISIRVRQEFIDTKTLTNKLRKILREQKVCTLIWGNGDVEGNFVLVDLGRVIEEQDNLGNIFACSLSLTLKEYEITSVLEVEKKNARANAGAVGSNATATVSTKVNTSSDKQTVVKNLTKARRYLNVVRSLTVSATAAYNGGVTDKLMFMGNSLGAMKAISVLRGPATDGSKHFDTSIGEAQAALSAVTGYLPVTGGNISDFSSALDTLAGKMDLVNVFGSIFTKQTITGRPNQYITPNL